MNELYEAIEKKIKASGYPRAISGADVYDDICDQIEGKENGRIIYYYQNLTKMSSLNIILPFRMRTLIWAF